MSPVDVTPGRTAEILGVIETRAAAWKGVVGNGRGTLKVPSLKLFGSLKLEDVQGQVKGYYLRCLLKLEIHVCWVKGVKYIIGVSYHAL